jgi:metal-sulfur cluster biosynthetic enzyme
MSYNVLLTTLEANAGVKLVVPIVTTKSTLTYTNCGKTGHSVETCHNNNREVPVVSTTMVKSTKLVARTKTQLVKSGKIHAHYPCIICFSVEHRSR